jgi:putative methyltransferase (TIGR04325 family)
MGDAEPIIWEGVYGTFAEAVVAARGQGFRSGTYLQRYRSAMEECIDTVRMRGLIPAFHAQRTTHLAPLVATVLARQGSASVFDFGGGFGIGYLACRSQLPAADNALRYQIVDFPEVCEAARTLFPDDEMLRFDSEISAAEGQRFDIVYSASALQYLEDWKSATVMLAGLEAPLLLLSDVFAGDIDAFTTLQVYHESMIPHSFLNIAELVDHLRERGYDLLLQDISRGVRREVVDRLPMTNLPPERRIPHAWHLLFRRRA